jgi:PEP-CTERM motif
MIGIIWRGVKLALMSGVVLVAGYGSVGTASAQTSNTYVTVGCRLDSVSDCGYIVGSSLDGTYHSGSTVSVLNETQHQFQIGHQFNSYHAEATARSNFGTLGVKTQSAFNAFDRNGLDFTRFVEGSASAHWIEYFTISSASLAFGTAVNLRFSHIIDIASISAIDRSLENSEAISFVHFRANGLHGFGCGILGINVNSDINNICRVGNLTATQFHVGRNIIEFDETAYVGQLFGATASLDGVSDATTGYGHLLGSATSGVDAIGTAHSYLTVLTAGVTAAAQSGHDYSFPALGAVPEPSSWVLMLAGFGLIGAAIRRREPSIRFTDA